MLLLEHGTCLRRVAVGRMEIGESAGGKCEQVGKEQMYYYWLLQGVKMEDGPEERGSRHNGDLGQSGCGRSRSEVGIRAYECLLGHGP